MGRSRRLRNGSLLVWMLLSSSLVGQELNPTIRFGEVGLSAGIQSYTATAGMGGGVSLADLEDDGDIDLFLPNGNGLADQLYQNLGNGQFAEVASSLGVAATVDNRSALWVDYNNDRRLDLFVANDIAGATSNFTLYEQTAGLQFVDVTVQAGLDFAHQGMHIGGMAAGDINQDGYLDLYVSTWDDQTTQRLALLLRNNGDGTFSDISVSSRVRDIWSPTQFQPMFADFNGDGFQDLYICVDFLRNLLWINQGDETFFEQGMSAGADQLMNDMGLAFGDYDNDGDLDLYCTNLYGLPDLPEYNVLLRNDSIGAAVQFTDVSLQTGVHYGSFGWGTTFIDADNDGWLDITATNGWSTEPWTNDPTVFYKNLGGQRFAEISGPAGVADTFWGSCLLAGDLDRDGRQDLVETCMGGPLRVLQNQSSAGNHLVVRPRMAAQNHRAIGAVVRATCGVVQRMRLISAGTSFLGQEPAEAFFGLGAANRVNSLLVEFPDGQDVTLTDLPVNQVITVAPPPLLLLEPMLGERVAGSLFDLLSTDSSSMTLSSEPGPWATDLGGIAEWVVARCDLVTAVGSPTTLDLSIRSRASGLGVETQVFLHDWALGHDVLVARHHEKFLMAPHAYQGLAAGNFVDAGGQMRLKMRSRRRSLQSAAFELELDEISVIAH